MIVTSTETKNTLFYTYQFELYDFTINANIQYNSRIGRRVLDLSLENGDVILQPTILDYGRLIFCTGVEALIGYEVLVWLEKVDENKGDDYLNWSNNFVISFGIRDREG